MIVGSLPIIDFPTMSLFPPIGIGAVDRGPIDPISPVPKFERLLPITVPPIAPAPIGTFSIDDNLEEIEGPLLDEIEEDGELVILDPIPPPFVWAPWTSDVLLFLKDESLVLLSWVVSLLEKLCLFLSGTDEVLFKGVRAVRVV